MLDLICVGDSTYDIFIRPHEAEVLKSGRSVSHNIPYEKLLCFSYGDKIAVESVDYSLGGTACNVAAGVAKLGLDTGLCSFCGNDEMGEKIKTLIETENIRLVNFVTDKKIHSTYSFVIRYKNDRTILVYRDEFDYKKLKVSKLKRSKWLYLSSLGKGYEKEAISLAAEKNIKIALNPGKLQLEEKKKDFLLLLKMAEILILNKEEAEHLLGARFPLEMKEIFYKVAEYGIKNLVVTDGVLGAYSKIDGRIIHQRAIKAKTVEVTGAGDAFSAGFLASYIKDENLAKALKWGVINGGLVTEEIGAQNGILTRSRIEEEYLKLI